MYDQVTVEDKSLIWNTDLIEAMELENLLTQGYQQIVAAENREESRGAQAREDFPDRCDTKWPKHTLTWQSEKATEKMSVPLTYREVLFHNFSRSSEIIIYGNFKFHEISNFRKFVKF